MSLSAKFIPIQTPKSLDFQSNQLPFSNYRSSRFISDFYDCLKSKRNNVNGGRMKALTNLSQHKSISSPVSIDLKPVLTETQFDRLIAESEESVIIIWIANWCRKCIYLKPKLEKLAADFHPRLYNKQVKTDYDYKDLGGMHCKIDFGETIVFGDFNSVMFYCIDVNNVPYKLVVRAGVTLWKDSTKQAEVIGGHKAYLVVNEVREMIEDEDQP